MVYITYANYKRIMADPKSIKQHFAMNAEGNGAAYIYDKKNINWFNELEASRLFLCKILLLQPNHPLFQKIEIDKWLKIITIDEYTHAFPPVKPKFHSAGNCPCLHRDYINFKLPVGFKEKYSENGVEQFREWFTKVLPNENYTPQQLLETNPKRFAIKAEARWNVDWSSIMREFAENSGKVEFHNYNLQQLEQKIDQLCQQFEEWRQTLLPIECAAIEAFKTITYCSDLSYQGIEETRLQELIAYFKNNLKYPMQEVLLAYYYQTAVSSGLSFENHTILEQLGFEACKHCGSNAQETIGTVFMQPLFGL